MALVEFKQTSDKPYDRHEYKVHFTDGKQVHFKEWALAQHYWFQWYQSGLLDAIEVLDKTKGFK